MGAALAGLIFVFLLQAVADLRPALHAPLRFLAWPLLAWLLVSIIYDLTAKAPALVKGLAAPSAALRRAEAKGALLLAGSLALRALTAWLLARWFLLA